MLYRLTKKKITFYISIATLIVMIVCVLTGLHLWNSHRASSRAAMNMADRLFDEITGRVVGRFYLMLGSVSVLTDSGANMPNMTEEPEYDGLSHDSLEFMIKSVENFDYIFSIYIGYSSGNFLQVIASRGSHEILATYGAPEDTSFIVRSITRDSDGNRKQYWRYLDKNRRVTGARTGESPSYDPRKRSWYLEGLNHDNSIFTDPYVFSSSRKPGITCAHYLINRGGVFGVDVTLDNFSRFLKEQKVSDNGTLFLFDHSARIIAHPSESQVLVQPSGSPQDEIHLLTAEESGDPTVKGITEFYFRNSEGRFDTNLNLTIENKPWLVRMSNMGAKYGLDQIIAVAAPITDFTGHIRRMEANIFLFSLLMLLLVVPLVFWISRKISRTLMLLSSEALKIQNFDFSDSEPFDSVIKEIHILIEAFSLMKVTIRKRTDALYATQQKLEKLVEQGIALAAERDIKRLVEMIFLAAKELAHADGGILYIADTKNDSLQIEIIRTDSLGISLGGTTGEKITFKPIPLYDPETGEKNKKHVASFSTLTGQSVNIDDISTSRDFDFEYVRKFDKKNRYHTRSVLTVPLKPRQGDVVGVLQLFNAKNEGSEDVAPFTGEVAGFVEALAAQAAIALDNQHLVAAQRELFNSFIQLLAGAIDAKSPYTGGHCTRVPELAAMLAQAAHDTKGGQFQDFWLKTDDDWREFRVAAWLHDCGKITTPEFVVDKSTKLQTIYNRIHEIRTRFEVLLRDTELDYYKKLVTGEHDREVLEKELDSARRQLIDDFQFLAGCNIGGEFMSDEKVQRVREIASRKWLRYFDNRLGLSNEELLNHDNAGTPEDLPVEESLLSDKPEHVTRRDLNGFYENTDFGFRMDIPDVLYNSGEIYNLCIRKGTLTEEERFKINEHVIQTIVMLNKLPFPKSMSNVSEIAGSHHETMIGSGYPRRLKKEDMSVPARIMVIADIFEALTASDRPYRKAKTLSEALRIMSFMRNDQHIDHELFDLFLTSNVYRQYAEKHLEPEQIDEVDIDQYLSVQ